MMDTFLANPIAGYAIEQLMQHPAGEKLKQAAETIQEVYSKISVLYNKTDEAGLTAMKVSTVMTFSILKKIAGGITPKAFSPEDWRDTAKDISDFAIMPDGTQYSVYIFSLYEKYIRYSVSMIETHVSAETVAAVNGIADELARKAAMLKTNRISEVQYTEDCLWLSLEAMIKLLASTSVLCKDKRIAEFAPALADLAFEYGRMKLYQRELEIINGFVESQYILDNELRAQYSAYIEELNEQSAQFNLLIDNAFSDNFKEAFLSSVLLAEASGVSHADILSSENDIDSFFLD